MRWSIWRIRSGEWYQKQRISALCFDMTQYTLTQPHSAQGHLSSLVRNHKTPSQSSWHANAVLKFSIPSVSRQHGVRLAHDSQDTANDQNHKEYRHYVFIQLKTPSHSHIPCNHYTCSQSSSHTKLTKFSRIRILSWQAKRGDVMYSEIRFNFPSKQYCMHISTRYKGTQCSTLEPSRVVLGLPLHALRSTVLVPPRIWRHGPYSSPCRFFCSASAAPGPSRELRLEITGIAHGVR